MFESLYVENVPTGQSMGADEPAGQYLPEVTHAVHSAEVMRPVDPPYVPAGHGFAVADVCPASQKKPGGHVPEHWSVARPVVEPYLPAAHCVGALTPATQKLPAGHTICVVIAVKTGQKKPAAHRAADAAPSAVLPTARHEPSVHAVPADWPAGLDVPTGHFKLSVRGPPVPGGHKYPAVHVVPEGDVAPLAQKVPAAQGFAVASALPVAVQKPAAQSPEHALVASPGAAPNLPAGHGFVVPDCAPSRQKKPTGHGAVQPLVVSPAVAPNVPAGHCPEQMLVERPVVAPNVPAGHCVQSVSAVLPDAVLYVPKGHGVAAPDPAGQ